jgi:hypothetical protein
VFSSYPSSHPTADQASSQEQQHERASLARSTEVPLVCDVPSARDTKLKLEIVQDGRRLNTTRSAFMAGKTRISHRNRVFSDEDVQVVQLFCACMGVSDSFRGFQGQRDSRKSFQTSEF